MKVGTEDRKKLIIAIVVMVVAVLSVAYSLLGSVGASAPAASTATPSVAVPAPAVVRHSRGGTKKLVAARSLDPSLRYDWLRASEDTKYAGTGRNIFRAQAEIPKVIAPPNTDKIKHAEIPTGPAPPPPPPPINLKFFGFASKPGEVKKVFLSQAEDVFIAAEGDIVDRRYKIMRISPMAVEIEDVLNNNRQSIPLTQTQ